MRGRHDHHVRDALWKKRKRRYKKRTRRKAQSGKRRWWINSHGVLVHTYSKNWELHNEDARQPPLSELVKNPVRVHYDFSHVYPGLLLTGGGKRNPPHVRQMPSDIDNPHPHQPHNMDAVVGLHTRSVHAPGHKKNRLDGFGRAKWAAWIHWKSTDGLWPSWDPLHRTPVDPDD